MNYEQRESMKFLSRQEDESRHFAQSPSQSLLKSVRKKSNASISTAPKSLAPTETETRTQARKYSFLEKRPSVQSTATSMSKRNSLIRSPPRDILDVMSSNGLLPNSILVSPRKMRPYKLAAGGHANVIRSDKESRRESLQEFNGMGLPDIHEKGANLTQREGNDVEGNSRRPPAERGYFSQGFYRRHYKPAELISAVPTEGDLLRALTTLAINKLTSDGPFSKRQGRYSTILSNYEESIAALEAKQLQKSNFNSPELEHPEHDKELRRMTLESYEDLESENESSVVSLDSGEIESPVGSKSSSKKDRVNRLRNHLKMSGLGEPVLVASSAALAEEERSYLARLLDRMNERLGPKKRERLKFKARTDFEMNVMRAKSFCEQHEEVEK